jgi:hypothetical protein
VVAPKSKTIRSCDHSEKEKERKRILAVATCYLHYQLSVTFFSLFSSISINHTAIVKDRNGTPNNLNNEQELRIYNTPKVTKKQHSHTQQASVKRSMRRQRHTNLSQTTQELHTGLLQPI